MSNNIANDCFQTLTDERCTLRAPLRHLAMVLAQLADWRTGRGIAGQGRIARATGYDARTVRRMKAELQALTVTPVAVTWRHRSRPDGLNGSDSYTVAVTPLGREWLDTGHPDRDTGQPGTRHRTFCPTNITLGSPQGYPLDLEKTESSFLEVRPLATSKLMERAATLLPDTWRPNTAHEKSASRLSVDIKMAEASFCRYHRGRPGSERSRQEWDATFGGWLKRQAPRAETTPREKDAAYWAAWHRGEVD